LAVGNSGTVLRCDGSRWSKVSMLTEHKLLGLAFHSGSNGWAVGENDAIQHFHRLCDDIGSAGCERG